MKKVFNVIVNPDNEICAYIMGVGCIACLLACLAAQFTVIKNSAVAIYAIVVFTMIQIVYSYMFIGKLISNELKQRKQLHEDEVELLQYVFGEIRKHSLYENTHISFTKKNKKIIKEVLRDFIGEYSQYKTQYYELILLDCEVAIDNLDHLK
jgi:hypothetical protein